VAEIDAELAALFDRMRESEGDLLLRAIGGGEWQRFKDDHPAREGNKSDEETAYGLCDSTALLADLGRFVVAWNGENFGADDWASGSPRRWLRPICASCAARSSSCTSRGPGPKSTIDRLVRHPAERDRLDLALGLGSPRGDCSAGSPRSDTSTTTPREPDRLHGGHPRPEFDDGDLERFLALRAYEAGVCSCGVHESLAADKNNVFAFEYRTCNVCKGLAQYQRVAADEAKRIAEQFENQPLINTAARPMGGG
jgi:hypothetical protein